MGSVGARLRAERKRLKMTQAAMGACGGVLQNAQYLYEKGDRRPDTDYLARIAAAGADVLYIVTGTRITAVRDPAQF